MENEREESMDAELADALDTVGFVFNVIAAPRDRPAWNAVQARLFALNAAAKELLKAWEGEADEATEAAVIELRRNVLGAPSGAGIGDVAC